MFFKDEILCSFIDKQGTHSNCSNSLSCTLKLEICSRQILTHLLPLESGNLQHEQTKLPVFWQNFQIACVFPEREFSFGYFPCFPCAVGTLDKECMKFHLATVLHFTILFCHHTWGYDVRLTLYFVRDVFYSQCPLTYL